MTLRATQESFTEALTMKNETMENLFEHRLCKNPRIPEQLALEIYRNNTRGVRIKALQQIYPVLEEILGALCFYQMAHDYVFDHPAMSSDLNVYGENFPEFIEQVVKDNTVFAELRYICDLSRLEWTFNAAYYADDDDINDLACLSGDDEHMVLKTSWALSLLQSAYPIYAIWQAHKTHNNVAAIAALTETDYLVVYRDILKPEVTQVDAEDWILLTEIRKTTNMRALAEFAVSKDIQLDQRLPAMVRSGWVIIE